MLPYHDKEPDSPPLPACRPCQSWPIKPIRAHALVFAVFGSLVAPFGGFLMSAVKRAYDIKDFDSLIPGHGGVTDRMDCQLVMILFTSVYFDAFIGWVVAAGPPSHTW